MIFVVTLGDIIGLGIIALYIIGSITYIAIEMIKSRIDRRRDSCD